MTVLERLRVLDRGSFIARPRCETVLAAGAPR